jgi:D-3-phosphoglycerate dehydrogenase
MTIALLTDADRFPLDDSDRALLGDAGIALRELPGHSEQEVLDAARDVDVILVYHARLTAEVIGQLGHVRVIARCGAGFDNIDVAAARQRRIELVYVPDYGIEDIADHSLALLLACARRVVSSDRAVRAGSWPSYQDIAPMHRLRGRTLGVYGYGRIGRNLADKARCLGLSVLPYDPYLADASVDREEIFRRSDFLSIHVPLTPETRHSIGEAEFGMMKTGAVLINTARGGIVVTSALVDALQSGKLAGAGIDVYDETPLARDHPLCQCENVVLTPHSAAFTEEGLSELRRQAISDAIRVLNGQAARHPIPDPPATS